jgi:predicted phosphodiesterase
LRIGIVSDVHCDAAGLAAALARLESVDLLLCAGDMVLQYRFSDEVVALLRDRDALAIQGNHDRILLSPHGDGVRRAGRGAPEHWAWLAAQPAQRRLVADGWRLLLAHGTPWDDPTELHLPVPPRYGEAASPGGLRRRDRRARPHALPHAAAAERHAGHQPRLVR